MDLKDTNKNLYSVSKTLRFSLTLKDDDKKNKTHLELKESIDKSEKNIKQYLEIENKKEGNKTKTLNEADLIKEIRTCFDNIKSFYESWQKIFERKDQIAVTKDYYRILAKKSLFDPFWKKKNGDKEPQSGNIKLSSLTKRYPDDCGEERSEYILNYWRKNRHTFYKLKTDFEAELSKYEAAIKNVDLSHTKPRLKDFRKIFLSIINLCNDVLIPLNNDSINFPNMDKLFKNKEDHYVEDFGLSGSIKKRHELSESIRSIKEHFKEEGNNVFWAKVTLNPYTAEQKPQKLDEDVKVILDKIKIVDLFKELAGKESSEIRSYFLNKDKKNLILKLVKKVEYIKNGEKKVNYLLDKSENNLGNLFHAVQAFKSTPIKASVRIGLSEYLEKQHSFDKEKLLKLFQEVGRAIDINKEAKENTEFNLNNYPLKQAFDYSWENLAKKNIILICLSFMRQNV